MTSAIICVLRLQRISAEEDVVCLGDDNSELGVVTQLAWQQDEDDGEGDDDHDDEEHKVLTCVCLALRGC